ncbi:MAG: hypothetical protein ACM3X0_06870 [Bacteroidota bacterium]
MDTTRDRIVEAIEVMLATNESININAVAKKCGISHALIYNRYPDLKERIKELKEAQCEKRKAADDQALVAKLMAQNKALLERVKAYERAQDAAAFKALLAHAQEVYSMYDGLLDDRNRLAAKVAGKGAPAE